MGGSVTISNQNRNLGDGLVSVGGVWRKITDGWVTTGGVWKQIYSSGLALSALPVGTLIKLNESGVGKNFYLACHDYESGLNGAGRTLLVRKDGYKAGAFGTSANKNKYATSTMDTWHNSTYKPMLSARVQELMGTTTFYYTPGGGTSGSAIAVTTLSRSVFQLSVRELGKTSSSYPAEGSALPIATTLQTCYRDGTTSTASQWTRTPAKNNSNAAYTMNASGGGVTVQYDLTKTNQYRPAFTLPANATVNPAQNADGSYTLIE